jgi:uncharacterized membrane protein
MKGKLVIKVLSFAAFLTAHWTAQFVFWSYAQEGSLSHSGWMILATPLFHLTGSLSSRYFWVISVLNSGLWASILTFFLLKFIQRRASAQ